MTIICFDFVAGRISTMPGVITPGVVYTPGPVHTSLVYPIEVIEGFDVVAGPALGNLFDAVGSIDVTSDLLSGVLTTTIAYKQLRAEPEELDVTSDLLSGVLTTTIIYITHYDPADDEGFDVSTDVISGTLT